MFSALGVALAVLILVLWVIGLVGFTKLINSCIKTYSDFQVPVTVIAYMALTGIGFYLGSL